MTGRRFETTAAFHELIDLIGEADATFLDGPRAVDDASVLEGYRWLTEILSIALECYVWADPARPSIVPIAGPNVPTRKWGGDNADSFYHFAPVDPARGYRLRGTRGDSCYLSITVYGGPTDGRWSTRIVETLNDRSMKMESGGSFEVIVSPTKPADADANWIELAEDSVALVTRSYLRHPADGSPSTWTMEALDPAPPPRLDDADLAARLRAAVNFLRDLTNINPLPSDPELANKIAEPYPVPQQTYGWAAGDAAYGMGRYELADGEALVIEGRSPKCVFWNMCLWNPFMQTYDYRYERVTINDGQVDYEADGSWRLVISAEDPGVANWVSTAGHSSGYIWFRWFLPEQLPAQPQTSVVALADLTRD